MKNIEISRVWAMPNSRTFTIKPIKELISKYNTVGIVSADPFSCDNQIATITNDIDTQYNCNYHMDAIDFLKSLKDNSIDLMLFDPPYSPRQVSECYKKMKLSVNLQTTQSSFWSKLKDEIKRVCKKDAICISFGWNSGGIGESRDFEIKEILIVPHGGWHNDTICTVERKTK